MLIVDRKGLIVARQASEDPLFGRFIGERLPPDVEAALAADPEPGTHVLPDGCLLHVVPIKGSPLPLRALVIEELRERAPS